MSSMAGKRPAVPAARLKASLEAPLAMGPLSILVSGVLH